METEEGNWIKIRGILAWEKIVYMNVDSNDAGVRKHIFLISPGQEVYHGQLMTEVNRGITSSHWEFQVVPFVKTMQN